MSNGKSTKSTLLSSVFSIVMCVAMLVGTTFAWFTDTATTSVDKIQAGNLNVTIEKYDGNDWVSAENETINFIAKDSRTNILWEPGATYKTEGFRVANIGNLALKYKLILNGATGDKELLDAIDFSIVDKDGNAVDISKFAEMLKAGEKSDELYVQGKMKETAGNECKGKSISGIYVQVSAAQASYENDSNGNSYDALAEYEVAEKPPVYIVGGDEEALKKVFEESTNNKETIIKLTSSIKFSDDAKWESLKLDTYKNSKITIDGNGYYIENISAPLIGHSYFSGVEIEIKNLTIKNSKMSLTQKNIKDTQQLGIGAFIGSVDRGGKVILDNCHVNNSEIVMNDEELEQSVKGAAGLVGYSTAANLIIKNCSVENTKVESVCNAGAIVGYTQHEVKIENATVKDCDIKGEREDKSGYVIGTANVGIVVITTSSECANNTVFGVKNSDKIYGRNLTNTEGNGSLTVNNVLMK